MANAPAQIPRVAQASLDLRVLGFAAAIAVFSALAVCVVPALHLPRAESLAGGRSVAGGGRARLRFALVTLQIAASLVLLTGAGLLLRSLWNMQAVSLGFSAGNVVAVPLTLGRQGYAESAQRATFFEQLDQRISAMPGASAIALADSVPPSGRVAAMIYSLIEVEGRPAEKEGTGGMIPWRTVTPGYFAVLGIPILRGRGFTAQDREPGQDSVVLSFDLARRLFGELEPLGHKLRFGRAGNWHTVVGITAPVNNNGFGKSAPEYYLTRKNVRGPLPSDAREGIRRATLLVKSSWSPAAAEAWIKKEIAALDPTLPVSAEPLARRVDELSARPRFNALLLMLFALTGLVLAAIGLYGVIAFLVAQRTREMGVRIALGATPAAVTRLVVSQAMQSCGAGLIAGLAASWFAARFVETLLFELRARDASTWIAASLVMALTAALAAWIPARRAGQVDPVTALRAD